MRGIRYALTDIASENYLTTDGCFLPISGPDSVEPWDIVFFYMESEAEAAAKRITAGGTHVKVAVIDDSGVQP
jgi:hypothetical protein